MKRSDLMKVIRDMVEDQAGVSEDEAGEFAGDLADRLEEEFGLIDEEDDEDEEAEEEL